MSKHSVNKIQRKDYPVIGMLVEHEFQHIQPELTEHRFAAGDHILTQGEVSGRFHIIVSGETEVLLKREIEVSVAKLQRGQFVGEMSCLTGEPVSATVRAIGEVATVSLKKEGLVKLMDISPAFRTHMLEAMVKRIQDSNQRVVEEHTRSHVVAEQLARERESRLGQFVGQAPAMQLIQQRIDELAAGTEVLWIIGESGTGKYHAAYEIHKRSPRAAYPVVTLEASEYNQEDWRIKRRASQGGAIIVRRADLLSDSVRAEMERECGTATRLIWTAEKLPSGIQVQALEMIPLRERKEDIPELVCEFLKREGVQEQQEAITQEALRLLSVYPYLRGNVEELGRIVSQALALSEGRKITGSHLRFGSIRKPGERPKIGLALGSGSVRGAAHVGVMKVLEEEGIPIDIIAGTSVGAFIGALYAGGQPISAFERVLPTVRWRQLLAPVFPPTAFADNYPMARFVEKFIGPVDFDELSIPFAAVASDALSGEAYILNKGRVSKAICASTAIPGVMKPVKYDNRLLIDGAVVHPVPVALCRSMGADIVIAIDVSVPARLRKRMPSNMVSSILNTIDIMSDKIVQEELQMADIVLKPEMDIQDLTFKSSAAFIERGVQASRRSLAEIREICRDAIR